MRGWEILAWRDPWFGALAYPVFRAGAITPEYRRRFYASGDDDIARLLAWLDADVGARPLVRPRSRHWLRCGLAYPSDDEDCACCRRIRCCRIEASHRPRRGAAQGGVITNNAPRPVHMDQLYIVFENISPPKGLKLIEEALAQAGPDCFLSLRVTFWREHAQPRTGTLARLRRRLIRRCRPQADRRGRPTRL